MQAQGAAKGGSLAPNLLEDDGTIASGKGRVLHYKSNRASEKIIKCVCWFDAQHYFY